MDDAQAPEVPGYDVGRLLGRGGSSDVWLAREQRTGRDYALKCFRAEGRRTWDSTGMAEEDVRREIRILSGLDHPHLVKVHDAVRTGEGTRGTALVMDYAAGGSLAQLVCARGKLSVGETVTVLTPIAQALGYLHGKGFTHSDVSPGNVLFTGQGKPLLSDVGIARMLGDPGGSGHGGTAGFLDPSPVDAVRAGLQPERDIYSTAALGWFCLTGAAPGRTADRPPLSLLVPGVPKELAAALEAGLSEDRRLRPGALALATAVYRSAEAQPVDLSGSVHPTVLPELLTRRHIHDESKRREFPVKLRALRRRAATARWNKRPTPAGTVPGTAGPPEAKSVGGRGKHAGEQHAGRRRRLLLRSVLPSVAAAVAGLLLLSGAAGQRMWTGSGDAGPPAVSAAPNGAVPGGETGPGSPLGDARRQAHADDPALAVRGLAALRDYAFNSGRLELLADVNVPGSAAAAADERIAAALRPTGQRLAGFTSTLSGVAADEGGTGRRAVVRVVAATSGYSTTGGEGSVVATGAATGPQPLRLVLLRLDGEWRVSDILPGL